MKATKHTLKVELEALSADCFRAMLMQLAMLVDDEMSSGEVVMDDGDTTRWQTITQPVEF